MSLPFHFSVVTPDSSQADIFEQDPVSTQMHELSSLNLQYFIVELLITSAFGLLSPSQVTEKSRGGDIIRTVFLLSWCVNVINQIYHVYIIVVTYEPIYTWLSGLLYDAALGHQTLLLVQGDIISPVAV